MPRQQFKVWDYPDGSSVTQNLSVNPPIDLNNLFKWAVPKLARTLIGIDFIPPHYRQREWLCNVEFDMTPLKSYRAKGETPALALFWAIYKVIEND